MTSKLMLGSKTAPIRLMVTEAFKELLRRNWDLLRYPGVAKMKRDCLNLNKIPFGSESDFITTVLRKDMGKTKFKFNWDFEINNPDVED